MKRKKVRAKTKTKTKSSGQFKSFALVILAIVLLVVIVMKFGGSSDNSPITYNPSVEAAGVVAPAGAYVTIVAERLDLSVGYMYYSDGVSAPTKLTDYRYTQPVIAKNSIYAIRYQGTNFNNFVLDVIRYDLATGTITSLAPLTTAGNYNGWYQGIDAIYDSATDTTAYAYSTNMKIVAKKTYPNGSGGYRTTTRTIYGSIIGQPSLSGNGEYIAYVSNNKAKIQKFTSYSGTTISSSNSYASAPMTNFDGSKVAFVSKAYPGNDSMVVWNRSSGQTTTVSLQDAYTVRFPDMDRTGNLVWQATRTGSPSVYHIYFYDGTATKDLTPDTGGDSVRYSPTISSDGSRVLHASSQKKIYSGTTNGGDFTVIATLPNFPQWVKLNRTY